MADNPPAEPFTNGFESLAKLRPGTPVQATLGKGKKQMKLSGVVTGHEYRSTNLWIFVELTYTDLAGVRHTVTHAVRPVQLLLLRESEASQ